MTYSEMLEKNLELPREKILRRNQDIKDVLKSGIKNTGATVKIYHQKSSEEKFAVLVTRRSGNAVERNRAKRIVREIYRSNPEWFINHRVVFLIKRLNISFQELKTEIRQLLQVQ